MKFLLVKQQRMFNTECFILFFKIVELCKHFENFSNLLTRLYNNSLIVERYNGLGIFGKLIFNELFYVAKTAFFKPIVANFIGIAKKTQIFRGDCIIKGALKLIHRIFYILIQSHPHFIYQDILGLRKSYILFKNKLISKDMKQLFFAFIPRRQTLFKIYISIIGNGRNGLSKVPIVEHIFLNLFFINFGKHFKRHHIVFPHFFFLSLSYIYIITYFL